MASAEDFLRRWARLKREALRRPQPAAAAPATPAAPAAAAQPSAPAAPAPGLPALESLTPESDFSAFMGSEVEEGVKRAALKKLFSDPRFNVIDPLDIDIEDYSKLERIPEETAKALAHAKRALFGPPEAEAHAAVPPPGEPPDAPRSPPSAEPIDKDAAQDGDPRQDA